MKLVPWSLTCALTAVLVLGCPGDPGPADGGSDAGTDGAHDAGTDGGHEVTLASITVTASSNTLAVNESIVLIAVARDAAGNVVETPLSWTSSEPTIVSVDAEGTARALRSGAATITATAGGRSGSVALTVTGAVHSGSITANEVWRAIDGPHLVTGEVYVGGPSGAILRIEAGTEVRFASGTGLSVAEGEAGALVIEGTAEKPVKLTAHALTPARGHWSGVSLGSGASTQSSLSHVTLEYCGHASRDACLTIGGEGTEVGVQSLTIRDGSSDGVQLWGGASFATGSSNLGVHRVTGTAVTIDLTQVHTLPAGGTFTNNGHNVVKVKGQDLQSSRTWINPGIPYTFDSDPYIEGPNNPTLTLSPGTELRFASQVMLHVGSSDRGNLRAIGTAAEPIVFTADSENPEPGFWYGIVLEDRASATSRLEHVAIRYGGIDPGADSLPGANLRVRGDKGPVLVNSRIEHSLGCGVVRVDPRGEANFATDFTAPGAANSFLSNAGGNQCGPSTE